MVFHHRLLRSATAALGLASLLVLLPGCPFSPDSDNGGSDTRIPPRTSVSGAIEQYAYIWENKRYPEYEALLTDDFEYFPLPGDLEDPDLQWMQGGESWGRTEELNMARNMFDENFVSQRTGEAIDSIDMTLEILNQVNQPDGSVQVSTHAVAQVLWAANSGARSDVRFEFIVVPDPDEAGKFQIKQQKEERLL